MGAGNAAGAALPGERVRVTRVTRMLESERERLEALDGVLTIRSVYGVGTRLMATIPLED